MFAGAPPTGVACETASNGFIVLYIATDGESGIGDCGITSVRGGYGVVVDIENVPLSVYAIVAHVIASHPGSPSCIGRQKCDSRELCSNEWLRLFSPHSA